MSLHSFQSYCVCQRRSTAGNKLHDLCVCVCDKMSLCDFLYLILSVHIWQLVHQIYFVFDRTGSLVEEWE